jgi:hypothetical protein
MRKYIISGILIFSGFLPGKAQPKFELDEQKKLWNFFTEAYTSFKSSLPQELSEIIGYFHLQIRNNKVKNISYKSIITDNSNLGSNLVFHIPVAGFPHLSNNNLKLMNNCNIIFPFINKKVITDPESTALNSKVNIEDFVKLLEGLQIELSKKHTCLSFTIFMKEMSSD